MQSTIRPLVKNKGGGDLTDPNNYRAIALANMETKILESILMDKLHSHDDCDKYQYGFKTKRATLPLCVPVLSMQELLYILDSHCHDLDIGCNTSKTVCMESTVQLLLFFTLGIKDP